MTKDVMIRIKGLQYAEGQESDTTVKAAHVCRASSLRGTGSSFVKYERDRGGRRGDNQESPEVQRYETYGDPARSSWNPP